MTAGLKMHHLLQIMLYRNVLWALHSVKLAQSIAGELTQEPSDFFLLFSNYWHCISKVFNYNNNFVINNKLFKNRPIGHEIHLDGIRFNVLFSDVFLTQSWSIRIIFGSIPIPFLVTT